MRTTGTNFVMVKAPVHLDGQVIVWNGKTFESAAIVRQDGRDVAVWPSDRWEASDADTEAPAR